MSMKNLMTQGESNMISFGIIHVEYMRDGYTFDLHFYTYETMIRFLKYRGHLIDKIKSINEIGVV